MPQEGREDGGGWEGRGDPPGQAFLTAAVSFKSGGHCCVCPRFRLAKRVVALGLSLEQKRGHAVLRAPN